MGVDSIYLDPECFILKKLLPTTEFISQHYNNFDLISLSLPWAFLMSRSIYIVLIGHFHPWQRI
jgi:hypothetical protein